MTYLCPPLEQTPCCMALSHVGFSYGEQLVLRDISLTIPQGKIVAIMGSSGSGKTTLLRLMAGLLRTELGEIRFQDQPMHTLEEKALNRYRRHMGILFQFGALMTDLNVFENIAFPLREHTRLPEAIIRDMVTLKLHVVGLRGTQSLMPSELSGGMARRVALARAIALDPTLMLYDEPFAGLDPISLSIIAHLIKQLQIALNATAIIVTHDIVESLKIVDYVYFIANGIVVAQGTPASLVKSRSPWLVQFIQGKKDGPVNFAYPNPQTLFEELS